MRGITESQARAEALRAVEKAWRLWEWARVNTNEDVAVHLCRMLRACAEELGEKDTPEPGALNYSERFRFAVQAWVAMDVWRRAHSALNPTMTDAVMARVAAFLKEEPRRRSKADALQLIRDVEPQSVLCSESQWPTLYRIMVEQGNSAWRAEDEIAARLAQLFADYCLRRFLLGERPL